MCVAVQLKITRCCTAPSQIKSPKTAIDKALEEIKFLGLHISWKSFGERKAKWLTFKIGELFILWVRKNVIMPSNKTTALSAWKSFSYGLWQCFLLVTVAACGVGKELRDPVMRVNFSLGSSFLAFAGDGSLQVSQWTFSSCDCQGSAWGVWAI